MKSAKLSDGTRVACLLSTEAQVLDDHVEGYFKHGIEVGPDAIIFDVGANIGVFGVRALQRGADIQVYAFEPVPTIFACLEQNAQDFGPDRFHAIPCGVSDQSGEMEFTYYPNSPALSTAKPDQWTLSELELAVEGSLRHPPRHMWYIKYLPKFISRWFAHRMRQRAVTFSCELLSLSEVIEREDLERVDLLKIDCEGAEYECLMGVKDSDWPKIKQVVVEVHDREEALEAVRDRLRAMGLTEQVVEQEPALRETSLYNVFARRSEVG